MTKTKIIVDILMYFDFIFLMSHGSVRNLSYHAYAGMALFALFVILGWIIFIQKKKISELNGEITFHFFLWAALCSAISNAILGNIIVDIVFGSVTGRPQADFVVQGIFSGIPNRIFATYFAGFIENLTDKMISACISFTLYKFVFGRISKHW